jgi:CheY-like chemotaxis protein
MMTDIDRTILIVEDDDLLRGAFKLLLEDAGYQVLEAGTAADALRLVSEKLPALVVLDLGLPDRPGLDVVRSMRQDPDLRDTPVVALTGRVGDEERRACLEAGCNRYLSKPVTPGQLLRELPELIRR